MMLKPDEGLPSMASWTALDRLSPNKVMLAPMVGLTHYAVRAAIAEFLAAGAKALWPTEMLNSRRIPSQHVNETPEVNFQDFENGLCPQLLANEEEFIRLSVPRLEKWGAQAIDINMGCPVRKALKHNYGVALMGDPAYAAEIVSMTVAAATVPVSVKLRAGFNSSSEAPKDSNFYDYSYLEKFIAGLFEAGAAWITIHPRTAEQKRRGNADWNLVRRLKESAVLKEIATKRGLQSLPIIGNGDVQCAEDITEMFEQTTCDRVMVGRALLAKPWLMSETIDPDSHEQGDLYGRFLKSVLKRCRESYEESAGMRRMRFLIVQGKAWVEYGEYLYGRMDACRNCEDMEQALEKFFSQKQKILKRTALRS